MGFLIAGVVLAVGAWWRAPRSGALLGLLLAALCVGAWRGTLEATTVVPASVRPGARLQLEGEVEWVREVEGGAQVLLQVSRAQGEAAHFRAALHTTRSVALAGQRVAVEARLRPIAPAGNPGQWDRFEQLSRRGQTWSGGFDADHLVVLNAPSPLERWLTDTRAALQRKTESLSTDRDAVALYLTLAAGLRAGLDDSVEEDFARSGLAHVLSVSGLHVAVLAFALLWALRRLLVLWPSRFFRRVDPRRVAAPLAIPLVWAYVVFTCMQGPAVRSAVMCSLFLLAHALSRRSDALNAISVAAAVMVLIDPSSLYDLSLQLSFLAVLALVWLVPLLRPLVPVAPPSPAHTSGLRLRVHRWGEAALQTAIASVAVTVVTAPLVLSAFQRVGIAGVLSNVVCMPLSGLLTIFSAGGAAIFTVSPTLAGPVVQLGLLLSRVFLEVAHGFAALPFASVTLPAPPGWVMACWWCGVLLLVFAPGRWRLAALSAPIALMVHLASSGAPVTGVDVTFLSVGHGDAVVISSAGHHALVDGGGVPEGADIGRQIVLPYLRQRSIAAVDLAVLSHPHPDHALGLASALQRVPTAHLWLPAGLTPGDLVDEVLDAAGEAEVELVERGRRPFALGEARLEVLGPPTDRILLESENDRSVVLRVRHGDVTFLLPGDVEEAGEQALEVSPVTVLKAPHHGSGTSSHQEFVDRVKPKYVVFCVGRHNRFGFPNGEVVERYQAAGARCYRTDLDGAITFHSDGKDVTVETFKPAARQARAR